jgi:hypothetical protein
MTEHEHFAKFSLKNNKGRSLASPIPIFVDNLAVRILDDKISFNDLKDVVNDVQNRNFN